MTIKFIDPNYLLNSGKVDERLIFADDHNNFNNAVMDDLVSPTHKHEILRFFIPYKISPVKAQYNRAALENFLSGKDFDPDIVAPSLVQFFGDKYFLQLGYPVWFFFAFPDVAWWLVHKDGSMYVEIAEAKYNRIIPSYQMLQEYIDVYILLVNPLECTTYKYYKELHRIDMKEYYEELFSILNEDRNRWQSNSKGKTLVYTERKDIILEISQNKEAFSYLNENEYIREDICHFCGKYPIDGSLKYTLELNTFNISCCFSCFSQNKKKIPKNNFLTSLKHYLKKFSQ